MYSITIEPKSNSTAKPIQYRTEDYEMLDRDIHFTDLQGIRHIIPLIQVMDVEVQNV